MKGQAPVEQLEEAAGAGQAPVLQAGKLEEPPEVCALKEESCLSSFLEPQWGQTGFWLPLMSSSEGLPQSLQMYSNRGMGVSFVHEFFR